MQRIAWIAVLFSLALGACQQSTITRCPPLASYSADFQRRAAEQLRRSGEAVGQLVVDYGKLRDACRASEASK